MATGDLNKGVSTVFAVLPLVEATGKGTEVSISNHLKIRLSALCILVKVKVDHDDDNFAFYVQIRGNIVTAIGDSFSPRETAEEVTLVFGALQETVADPDKIPLDSKV